MRVNFFKKSTVFLISFLLVNLKIAAQGPSFDAKGILYLHDAEFNTFTFALDNIEKEAADQDKIGAYKFPLNFEDSYRNSEKVVANSVLQSFKAIVTSTNNRLCYVAETYGGIKKEQAGKPIKIRDLDQGSYVSVIDISNLQNLKADYRFKVGLNPHVVSLNKNNDYLAVGAEEYNQEFQVFELDGSGKPIRLLARPSLMNNGCISDIVWHPSEDYIAYINSQTKEVGLLKVIRDLATRKIIRLEIFGNPMHMDGLPVMGLFSKDGNFFYVLDRKSTPNSTTSFEKGQVYSIKFNFEDPQKHVFLSKVEVDMNPSAMLMHPGGKNLLVSNIKRSFEYPVNDRNTGKANISLLTVQADGTLQNKGLSLFEGIMPLGMAFDKGGKNLAVSCFQFLNYGKPMGGIEFFKFTAGDNPVLEKQNQRINTGKGVHNIKVIEDY
jgi:Lactonase, 7-bladed beta-propeller